MLIDVERFARNTLGRDWAVGDIHGHFSRLRAALDVVRFDPERDRLFSVGDLTDRGPECHEAPRWLAQPWFHAVQGNHEDYAVRYVRTGMVDTENWRVNGGGWFLALSPEDQRTHAETYARMPLVIEVETADGLVGLVHADCPVRDWNKLARYLRDRYKRARGICQWSRERLARGDASGVRGIRAVVVGHTPLATPTVLGNVYHIDTAGWMPDGYFTLLDLATLRTTPRELVQEAVFG
ncbi:serine/threonine protein phosphatase [Bordetella genomosp. 9]|uniref:Serine/threonine protein phosphatase n=1 Tax=Bordetella genomosp. 9 TaxID=1416803 RepID=A0A261RFH6_9BORD|nr:metallophosphoesterase [Bordetella genomosp. 9]OZI23779.1 serine/threonine protein phosphatase [Bordetella genomosp. 9]